jgi:hypothetical protein
MAALAVFRFASSLCISFSVAEPLQLRNKKVYETGIFV